MILFPAIDIQGGHCVRLKQGRFDEATDYGDDPVAVAVRWQRSGAQWLHVVDLDGARMGASTTAALSAVERIAAEVGLPVQFGGGLRTVDSIARALKMGATRVVVGTAVSSDADFARGCFAEYAQRVAVGIDARNGLVATHGWQSSSGESADAFARRVADLGASRIIFTDIARDGMLEGVSIASLRRVADAVPELQVIASGGVADLNDIMAIVGASSVSPNIEGAIVGKALYAGTLDLREGLEAARSRAASLGDG